MKNIRVNTVLPFIPLFGFLYLLVNSHWEINHAKESVLDSKRLATIVGIIQGTSIGIVIIFSLFKYFAP